jgi:hypothetical protein
LDLGFAAQSIHIFKESAPKGGSYRTTALKYKHLLPQSLAPREAVISSRLWRFGASK